DRGRTGVGRRRRVGGSVRCALSCSAITGGKVSMRTLALRGPAVAAALALAALALTSSANAANPHHRQHTRPAKVLGSAGLGSASRLMRPGLGPTHWYRGGHYGWWGKRPFRPGSSISLFAVDNLANPGNGEIMPTTNTYLIFWLPAGFHYND